MTVFDHLVYGLLWLSFGWGHSLLAGEAAKRRLAGFLGAEYRLVYNLVATFHIALVMLGGQALLAEPAFRFAWTPEMALALLAAKWTALAILIGALTQYDLGRFAGFTQIMAKRQGRELAEDEPLHLTSHAVFRYPY